MWWSEIAVSMGTEGFSWSGQNRHWSLFQFVNSVQSKIGSENVLLDL